MPMAPALESMIPIDRDEIIVENKKEIDRRLAEDPGAPEAFCVADERLDEALQIANAVDSSLPHKERVVRTAARFMGGLAWAQPFCGANKYTAFMISMYFIKDNGYELNIEKYDDTVLVRLLLKVQEDRLEPDREAMDKLVLYIRDKLVGHGRGEPGQDAGGDP